MKAEIKNVSLFTATASKHLSSKFLKECLDRDGLSPGGKEYTLESLKIEYAKRGESEAEKLWQEFLKRSEDEQKDRDKR